MMISIQLISDFSLSNDGNAKFLFENNHMISAD